VPGGVLPALSDPEQLFNHFILISDICYLLFYKAMNIYSVRQIWLSRLNPTTWGGFLSLFNNFCFLYLLLISSKRKHPRDYRQNTMDLVVKDFLVIENNPTGLDHK
jgi:hypothetical protein